MRFYSRKGRGSSGLTLFPVFCLSPTEALLVVFDIQLGFNFRDLTPAYLNNVSVFLTGYLSLMPPSLCFLFVFEFGGAPCSPTEVSWHFCLTSHTCFLGSLFPPGPYSMGLQQKSLKRHILFSLLGKKSLAVKSDECCLLHTASSELQMLLPWEHPGETWCCIHMWKGCIFMSVSDRSGGQWCGKDENCCGVLHGVLKQGSLSVNLAGDNLLKQVVTDRE